MPVIWRGAAAACAAVALAATFGAARAQPGSPGGSQASAIVLPGVQHEADGVPAEYAYIREHFPGCRPGRQALLRDNGRSYDSIQLSGPNCAIPEVFFDITGWFGK